MFLRVLDGMDKLSAQNLSALGGTLEDVTPYIPQPRAMPAPVSLVTNLGVPIYLSGKVDKLLRASANKALGRRLGAAAGKAIGRVSYVPVNVGMEALSRFGIPGIVEGRYGREQRGAYNYGANIGRQLPFLAHFANMRRNREAGLGGIRGTMGQGITSSLLRARAAAASRPAPTYMPPRRPDTDVRFRHTARNILRRQGRKQ